MRSNIHVFFFFRFVYLILFLDGWYLGTYAYKTRTFNVLFFFFLISVAATRYLRTHTFEWCENATITVNGETKHVYIFLRALLYTPHTHSTISAFIRRFPHNYVGRASYPNRNPLSRNNSSYPIVSTFPSSYFLLLRPQPLT